MIFRKTKILEVLQNGMLTCLVCLASTAASACMARAEQPSIPIDEMGPHKPGIQDFCSETPIHVAVRANDMKLIQELLKSGAMLDTMDTCSNSLVHSAARASPWMQ